MRLVLIGPVYPFRGGIAHYTTMLCRSLRERGHEVLLISFRRQYPQWLFPGSSDSDPSATFLEAEGAQYWIDSLNPITWVKAFWRIRRYQPDVIVLQWWTSFWAATWLTLSTLNRLVSRRPLVYICHNVMPHEVHLWDPLLTKTVLQGGTHCIVHSEEERGRLLQLLPGMGASTVPLPVFDMFSGERVSRAEARMRLRLPTDDRILLFFGMVRAYKGLEDILAALPEVRRRLSRVHLLVAGEFWNNKDLYLELIERYGIGDAVTLEDRYIPNEEVKLYFAAADLLVAPYRRVTGSAVVQMARGFDLPAITTWSTGSQGGGLDEGPWHLVRPGDVGGLAKAITDFFESGETYRPQQAEGSAPQGSCWDDLAQAIERCCP